MMKRLLAALCLAVLLISVCPVPVRAAQDTINVYNWGQYISDGTDDYIDVNRAFTEATGIQVNYMTFDSNESLYTKLKTGGSSYDVIIPSDYMVARLISEGMLLELNFDHIPNYQYIDEAYRNTDYDPENRYSIPYTWGTMGVIYNTAYVDEEDIGSWDLLWNEKYAGKILMFDNPRDAFAVAEAKLGYSMNTSDPDELRACAYELIAQKPLVQAWVMDQIYDAMEHEEAWIAPYYAGDYLQMLEVNEDLGFYFPEEGFNFFIDAACIPTSCTNKAAAEAYINFLCEPEIMAENLDYLGYSVPSEAAKEFMDEEAIANPVAYPDAETLARGEAFLSLDQQTNQLMDKLWLSVKTSGGANYLLYGGIAVAVIVIVLIIVLISRKNRLARRRRGYTR
jgi:spermidine/putrescine transport system substrate-binding protein